MSGRIGPQLGFFQGLVSHRTGASGAVELWALQSIALYCFDSHHLLVLSQIRPLHYYTITKCTLKCHKTFLDIFLLVFFCI